ncbi:hypothetical protein FDECE_17040 [Fusarium decemcellulare]|nr:hypothetical protein FDECE_17040 [Fusarium decemcellulare]
MPAIDEAMARSLRGSAWEILKDKFVRTIAADLARRDMVGDAATKVDDFTTAISSWDNCMSVAWCKWPLIGIIVLGGLIVFSILWCIIRCCCCGLSCCCSCFQCLKCCGNCCGACDPPGGRSVKHLDDPYAPQNQHHGYRSEPPMNPTVGSTFASSIPASNTFASKPVHNEPPQYAEFEMSKPRNEDALPEMPSWEGANSKKVVVHEDAVELDSLKKPVPDQQMGVMDNTSSSQLTPYSQGNSSGYLAHNNQAPDHYSPLDGQGYGYNAAAAGGYGADQAYGAAMGPGQHSHAQNLNGYGQDHGYDQTQGYGQTAAPQNDYANYGGYRGAPSPAPQGYGMRQAPGPRRTPAPQDDFDNYGQLPRRSPAPQNDYGFAQPARHSPAPQNDYGYNQPSRHSPAPQNDYGYNQRNFTPAPEAHYGPRPVPQRQYNQEPPQSPINNNSGFDFNSGYARPQPSPTQDSYPGFKPYQP